ncbi:MAG: alpha/beta fold hydrolase [Motilibacteraceae bacterium]
MVTYVLVHAFPLSRALWDDVRPRLETGGNVLLTPDLPGFGGRPVASGEPSLDAFADDVAGVLERVEGRVVLGGLSMGGYTLMALLRRHPDVVASRVAGLVLADTKAGADAPAAAENRERVARTILEERSPRVLLDDVLPTLLGQTTFAERPEVVARVRSMLEAASPEGVAWAQRAMAARPDSHEALRATTVPTLVVRGDEDALSSAADTQAMVDALPRGELTTLARCGHLSALEDPKMFVAAVDAFAQTL